MTVIRERLAAVAARLAHIDVALFCTFNFSADFFEQNVLPALFGAEPGASRAVREARVHKGLLTTRVGVFYDASMLKPSRRRFRYAATPVYQGQGKLFHPKNIVLFGHSAQGERWIYVATMSANLTTSGWGKNVEGVADTWIHARAEQPARALFDFLAWLKGATRPGSEVLAAARAAWTALREYRKLDDPEGGNVDRKKDLQLYFSPLHDSLWDFIAGAYGAPTAVLAGSPYWGDSTEAAKKLGHARLELVAARCAPHFRSVNLGKNTLAQLYPKGVPKDAVRTWHGDRGRFYHLKLYQADTGRGKFLGLGSCNFTDRGQFWTPTSGNVESMLFDRTAPELPAQAQLDDAEVPLASSSEDMPDILPAYVFLQYDWRDGEFRWRLAGSGSALPVTLHPPDGGAPVMLTADGAEGRRKGVLQARTFKFACAGGEVYEGLVEELNVDASTLTYGRMLAVDDILESWRLRSAAEPPPPGDDDDGPEAPPPPAPDAGRQAAPFDWFLFYRCARDMERRLGQAAADGRSLVELALARSDSVLALCDAVLAGPMPPVAKWLVARECSQLLAPHVSAAPLLKARRKNLEKRMQALRTFVEKELEGALAAQRATGSAGDVLAWYEKQLRQGSAR
ncbi:MAG: hypothetical protein ACJ8LG_06395 [Massilia sp.]